MGKLDGFIKQMAEGRWRCCFCAFRRINLPAEKPLPKVLEISRHILIISIAIISIVVFCNLVRMAGWEPEEFDHNFIDPTEHVSRGVLIPQLSPGLLLMVRISERLFLLAIFIVILRNVSCYLRILCKNEKICGPRIVLVDLFIIILIACSFLLMQYVHFVRSSQIQY
jgi:hypothetical protein